MTSTPHVAAVCGSLRDDSATRVTLRRALAGAEAAEATADAVVLGTPVYHHSYSAPLKNLLDFCGFDEFEETVVGVVAVAGGGCGGFPTEALGHLRGVALGLRAWVHPTQVTVPNAGDKVVDGELVDPGPAERVGALGEELARCGAVDGGPEGYVTV